MKILDIFCGAGGFSCGFLDKGNTFIGVDNWEVALETYKNNIKGEIIKTDIMLLDLSTVGKVDILIGSPPCQPHSIANRLKDNDPKHIQKYLDVVDELKPKWWVMEEVPGAIKTGLIPKHLQRHLKASEFGLPHERDRIFPGNYPDVIKCLYRGDILPTVETVGYGRDLYRDALHTRPSTINLLSMFKTPIAEMRGYFHGKQERIKTEIEFGKKAKDVFTPSFCAKIMGFPDWYVFSGNKTQQYRQIGNAVCPPVSRAIWNAIKNPSCILGNL